MLAGARKKSGCNFHLFSGCVRYPEMRSINQSKVKMSNGISLDATTCIESIHVYSHGWTQELNGATKILLRLTQNRLPTSKSMISITHIDCRWSQKRVTAFRNRRKASVASQNIGASKTGLGSLYAYKLERIDDRPRFIHFCFVQKIVVARQATFQTCFFKTCP